MTNLVHSQSLPLSRSNLHRHRELELTGSTSYHVQTVESPQDERSRPYIVTAEQWKESAIALEAEVTRLETAQTPLLQKIAELEEKLKEVGK